jgi:hypothetical protein
MNKNTLVSALFVVLAMIVAAGSIYLVLSYATDMLNAIVAFVSTNDLSKLEKCGINLPAEFGRLKADLTAIILPFLYIGMPAVIIVVGILTFLAGFYFHKSKHEDECVKKEQIEREMVHKLVRKISVENKPAGDQPQPGTESMPLPEEAEGGAQQDAPAPEPAPKATRKRK